MSHVANEGHRVANRENSTYCFTLGPAPGVLCCRLPSCQEVENIVEFPREEGDREPREISKKQVLGNNKGVSIRCRTLFICKRRGWPSVRIISLDFHHLPWEMVSPFESRGPLKGASIKILSN